MIKKVNKKADKVDRKKADQPEEPVPYTESAEHVPNQMYQTGTVDTTDVSGGDATRVEDVSPLFDEARAAALTNAVDALDHDPEAAEDLVVFPATDITRDEAEANLREAEEAQREQPKAETAPNSARRRNSRVEEEDSGLA